MKRFVSLTIMMAMLLGLFPAAHATSSERWQTVARQCEELGLEVTWYPEQEGLMRRYGTDRMLLVQGGKSYLYSLRGDQRLAGPFDAFGEFNGDGLAPACQNGKWGVVDMGGKTVVDFIYDSQYEAELAGEAYPVFKGKNGKDAPPYALFTGEGEQLTEYNYQAHDRFVNSFAMVTVDGTNWGYVNTQGEEIGELKYRHEAPLYPKYADAAATEYGVFDKDGFAIVYSDGGFNVINSQGRELLETPSPKRPWRAGDGTWGFVDAESGKVGFLYGTGQVAEEPQYDDPGTNPKGFQQILYRNIGVEEEWLPHEGLRRFQTETDGLWGFWDATGEKTVVPALFDAVGYFDYGYASVLAGGVFGLLRNPLLTLGGMEENAASPTFTDVPAGSWFEKGVMTCARAGIMVGTGENTFSPNATLTDAETLMLAYRLYDQALGGDGSLMKMPADYGYIKIVTDDGGFVHEGYVSDRERWTCPVVYSPVTGMRLCLRSYGEYTGGASGAATLTFGGKEYRGTLKHMYRGSGRYEQDNFLGFEPEDPALNDLLSNAYFGTASPDKWWADLLYTIQERGWGGWDGVFSGATQLFGTEDSRGGFADLLGTVTDLPKKFDIPPIPDWGERGEKDSYSDHIYELYEAGIIGGLDAFGTFDAEKTLTRAEAAVMVARVLDESQRLTTPPKPMPKEGEGYTLTYLRDGIVDSAFEEDTYPYYFVAEPVTDPDGWAQSQRVGFLKLNGSFVSWPESDIPYTVERFGGDTIYWANIYKAKTDEELDRYEVGVLNDDLEWIIQPQYAELWPREGGYAAVTQEDRYLLLDEKGNVEGEVGSRQELPERPFRTWYHEYWTDWQNWGGLSPLPDGTYYRWPDGSPATEKFDFCGRIGPDGRGFVQRDGKIYRIQFTQPER